MPDLINHPPHYKKGGIEAIDVIEAWALSYCLGQVVKYICRLGKKGTHYCRETELQDLKKAQWYLARHIAQMEEPPHGSAAAEEMVRRSAPELRKTVRITNASRLCCICGAAASFRSNKASGWADYCTAHIPLQAHER